MQYPSSKFHWNLFQTSNFIVVKYNPLSFKTSQLKRPLILLSWSVNHEAILVFPTYLINKLRERERERERERRILLVLVFVHGVLSL